MMATNPMIYCLLAEKEGITMANEIRRRSDVADAYKWDLTHIYPSDEAWEADLVKALEAAKEFAKYDGKVSENPKEVIRTYFDAEEVLSPVFSYAFLRKETDNADGKAQEIKDKAMQAAVQISMMTAFMQPELLAMDEEALKAIAADPEMTDYDTFIGDLLREKAHALPKEQEQLLAMMGQLQQAPQNIFGMLTDVDMKFPDVVMPDGTTRTLTEGTYSSFIQDANRDVRKQGFDGIMGTYGKFANTITATYAANVQKDVFNARARKYSSCRAAKMEPLQIPEAVYDNLISVIHEYIPVLNEYLALRKDVMKLDELHMYDLYTPIVGDFKMELPYDKAYDMVLEGLTPMGEDYLDKLREARTGGWIDVYPTQNKSSGAFSSGNLRNVHPYVLLNHNDNLSNTFTIAHELGHSMHSFYSNTHQPAPKSDYSLFVAEVASTCNEAVMMRYLLKTFEGNKKAQAYLLNHFLEQFRTTAFRQTMFAEFEYIAHTMAEKGQPLTRDALTKVYYDLNQQYYGGVCDVDELIGNEWMRIPHFYRSFYVYVYATGLCAAITLSDKILNEGQKAVEDYRKFLSAGSSVPPIEALKLAGIDMSSPEPIRKAMEVFKATLEQFKAVL
ncbi:MAG: oligoendopeptidase F [Clostridiales bacterium]|nr:oligoendopeptidase F [Clostridiales bacterium]